MSGLVLKSPAEIEIMDRANAIVREVLDRIEEVVRPGISTGELDRLAEEMCRKADAIPAFKGYPHRNDGHDFPGTICASVNSEVVHGVPSEKVVLDEGDIISVDMGVLYRGYYGDSARTYGVGKITDQAEQLLQVTRDALAKGVAAATTGNRVSDIGHAVQQHVEGHGLSVVREFVGHGIGANLHEDPQIPNFGKPGRRERLVKGLVLAIEPMVNLGGPEVVVSASDGWTARTRDDSLSAHFEVCVAVTEDGPQVLGLPRSKAA